MDLRTAVAASMLPASRSLVAARFKELSSAGAQGSSADLLTGILRTLKPSDGDSGDAIASAFDAADEALQRGAAAAMEAIALGDSRYPALLASTTDPPPVLWTLGNPAALHEPTVAVVGARAATPYALQVGERLAGELATRGVVVASGLARGVDAAAHRGCLAYGGRTVAVLGSGLDRVYPAEHRDLAADIIRKEGCLVSELGPGAAPVPEHFPLRNRIISGISLAVVVVEASDKSGSLITARYALEQGRDVMAVPGSVLTGRNRGSHSLLKDGAKVVETADDILDGVGWPIHVRPSRTDGKLLNSDPLLARMEPGEAYHLDELIELTGVAGPRLLTRLTELELLGLVATAGMGRFVRVVT
jgi:DNA processing protein